MNRIAIYLVYFLLLPCQFASAEVWDIRNEFFSANKPGSAWKLGEFLDHYPFFVESSYINYYAPWSWPYWTNSDGNISVGLNTSPFEDFGIKLGDASLESDFVTPVARWVAPYTNRYRVHVTIGGSTLFQERGYGNNNVDISQVLIDGIEQPPTDSTFYPGLSQKDWTFSVLLDGGKTIDAFVDQRLGGGNTNLKFTVETDPCGPGINYVSGYWQQLALPCVPNTIPASVGNVFGISPTANFNLDKYDRSGDGWALYRRDVSSTPSSYVKLLASTPLQVGVGYWIKSLSSPVNNRLTVNGSTTPTDVAWPDCASANGCKAIALTTVSGQNRYNLVGNPFPYAIDWSKVRVRVGGSGGTVYSPCQAFGVLSGDCTGPAASVAHPPVIDNAINIWECTPTCDYHVYSDLSPDKGNLKYFMSFWVNVLPGAFEQTVELLIPAEASTLTQAKPAALPWYLAWLDWIASPAEAASQPTSDWWVSLKLKNHVNGGESGTVRLGQLGTAQAGYDAHDLPKLAPFAAPYLSLAIPHAEWPAKAGDYATDYRPALVKQPQDWSFEVRADPATGVVFINWEGDAKILKRSRLIDVQTGKIIQPAAKKWAKKGYPITLQNSVQRYVWRYLGK